MHGTLAGQLGCALWHHAAASYGNTCCTAKTHVPAPSLVYVRASPPEGAKPQCIAHINFPSCMQGRLLMLMKFASGVTRYSRGDVRLLLCVASPKNPPF